MLKEAKAVFLDRTVILRARTTIAVFEALRRYRADFDRRTGYIPLFREENGRIGFDTDRYNKSRKADEESGKLRTKKTRPCKVKIVEMNTDTIEKDGILETDSIDKLSTAQRKEGSRLLQIQ